jgi:hypothetical protein
MISTNCCCAVVSRDSWAYVHRVFLQQAIGVDVQLPKAHKARQAATRQAAEKNIFRHRELGHILHLLVDHADPELVGRLGVAELDLPALENDPP